MSPALLKALRGGRPRASTQLLLPATGRRMPREGVAELLPRLGSTAPLLPALGAASPAAGLLRRLMHTWRASRVKSPKQKALPFGSKRFLSDKFNNLPPVTLPKPFNGLEGVKDSYVIMPGTPEVHSSKFFLLHLAEKIGKVSRSKASYQTKWGFPAFLVTLLFSFAVAVIFVWEKQKTNQEEIDGQKSRVGKVDSGIDDLGVLMDRMENNVSYLESKKGKQM